MKLIKENQYQRYYQLDFQIKFFGKNSSSIADLFKHDPIKLKELYELAEDISESINKVCVSDAHTHIERLVFPAFNIINKETGEIELCHRCNNIDGKHTFMTRGGDPREVHDDAVYIRHLRMINIEFNQ